MLGGTGRPPGDLDPADAREAPFDGMMRRLLAAKGDDLYVCTDDSELLGALVLDD